MTLAMKQSLYKVMDSVSLHPLVKTMKSEHNIILEKSEAQDLIIDQAIENSQQYSLLLLQQITHTERKPEQ